MGTEVPTEFLMGRVENNNSYHRLDLICPNNEKDYEARLKYDCGVYFIFSCSTTYLRIKTKIHYKPTFDSRKVATELQVLGKTAECGELLNITYRHIQALCDEDVIFYFNIPDHNYEEFQICLPSQGRIDDYLLIETENKPVFKQIPLKAILLGSSVAQDNNSSSHMNICCYAYRKLNINIATLGISYHNSLTCKTLLEKLLNKNIKIIIMDILNTTGEDLVAFKNMFTNKDVSFLVISNKCRKNLTQLLKDSKDIDSFDIDANGRYDINHLNDYGTTLYLDELHKKGLL